MRWRSEEREEEEAELGMELEDGVERVGPCVGEGASVMLCCGGVVLRDEDEDRMTGPSEAGR